MPFMRTLAILMLLTSPCFAKPESGLPIPRFVSMKSDEANLRTGPGQRYPIRWVYQREDLPMEVINEHGHWRELRDVHGETGWVHRNLLSGSRHAIVITEQAVLYQQPDIQSEPILRAENLVIGSIKQCTSDWCLLEIDALEGWIEKRHIWGTYPDEVIEE